MNTRTRTSLFLMEQLAAITVFAVCAAVCAWIFTEAFYKANDARDINYALMAAKNGAEAYKAYGSPEKAAEALAGRAYAPGEAAVYYDKNWRVCDGPDAAYVLRLTGVRGAISPPLCRLSVERAAGEEIIAFTAAARWRAHGG